ncbi:MAG TPA: sigma-70 family RNA polymerase sigma factor [Terracidiphilus sp.]|nr:sigma-70 family RNA polymerase sigma factor [Terracidiphilus sp.]
MRPELIRASKLLQNGSPRAAEEAIGLLQNTVYGFSMKVCGHPEDAEDTMQEVLYRSLPYLAKIQEPRALAVWLYTVTRNRCWRMRRKPAGAPAHTLSLDDLMPNEAELAHLLEDTSQTPEKDLLNSERQSELHRVVLKLPVPLRLVLVLHDMEELTTDETAQVLGLQPGTVRVRLHRARLAVRKLLQQTATEATHHLRKRASHQSLKRRPADCRDIFANLSELIDDHADPATCERMQAHIDACPACVAFLGDLRRAIDRCRSLETPCSPAITNKLNALFTREYLDLIGTKPEPKSGNKM